MRLAAGLVLGFSLAFGQASYDALSASLQGYVRDAQGRPVSPARIWLDSNHNSISTQTASDGKYQFAGLSGGTYKIRVQEHSETVTVEAGESKRLDLVVQPAAEFFDEPNFVVAGVTDTTNQGGHGSGIAVRSSESLTKAAAALGAAPSGNRDPLEAVREYQRAAEQDPSEANLFRWGIELLTHEAAEPATQVFAKGHRLFPESVRMILALAVSWYARGAYDNAGQFFFAACDIKPSDPAPYSFLSQAQSSEISLSAEYLERMARFARLHPESAEANYDYAAALWKQQRDADKVEALLKEAIQLDPHYGSAYLLLGILCEEQNRYPSAVASLEKAAGLNPADAEVHYRLAQLYRREGEAVKADRELQLSRELSKKAALDLARERSAVGRFVWRLREAGP